MSPRQDFSASRLTLGGDNFCSGAVLSPQDVWQRPGPLLTRCQWNLPVLQSKLLPGKLLGEKHCFRANQLGRGAGRHEWLSFPQNSVPKGTERTAKQPGSGREQADRRPREHQGSFLPEKFPSLGFSSPDVMGYFFGEIPFFF